MRDDIVSPGQIVSGPLFNEPMRVETVRPNGADSWTVELVGVRSERFRSDCDLEPTVQDLIKDPARFPRHEVTKVAHYWLEVDALTSPMEVREQPEAYGG